MKLQTTMMYLKAPFRRTFEGELPGSEPQPRDSTANALPSADKICRVLLGLMVLGYCVVFTRLTFGLFERCAYMNFDLGIFDQAVWLISRGERPFVTLRGVHILGDHFSAILYLIAPLYWIAPTPKTLLLVQTVALALGAIPVYALARLEKLAAPVALLFSGVYLCYPAMQWSNTYEFHPETFATPLLLFAFYFLNKDQLKPYLTCLVFACLTKETIGLTVVFLGIYAFCEQKKKFLLPSIVLGMAALLIAGLSIRYFNGSPSPYIAFYEPWTKLSLREAIQMLGHIIIGHWFYYFKLLVPVLFLSLVRPKILLLVLPSLASNLLVLVNRPGMKDIEEHYTVLITPFLLCAMVLGFSFLNKKIGFIGRAIIMSNLVIWSVGGMFLWGPFSVETEILYTHRNRLNAKETRNLLNKIPEIATVSAQMPTGSQLSCRKYIYQFPNPFQKMTFGGNRQALQEVAALDTQEISPEFTVNVAKIPVEYVVLSPNSQRFPLSFNAMMQAASILLKSPFYGVESIGRGVIVLHRGADHDAGLKRLADYVGDPSDDPERLLWVWLEKSEGLDS